MITDFTKEGHLRAGGYTLGRRKRENGDKRTPLLSIPAPDNLYDPVLSLSIGPRLRRIPSDFPCYAKGLASRAVGGL